MYMNAMPERSIAIDCTGGAAIDVRRGRRGSQATPGANLLRPPGLDPIDESDRLHERRIVGTCKHRQPGSHQLALLDLGLAGERALLQGGEQRVVVGGQGEAVAHELRLGRRVLLRLVCLGRLRGCRGLGRCGLGGRASGRPGARWGLDGAGRLRGLALASTWGSLGRGFGALGRGRAFGGRLHPVVACSAADARRRSALTVSPCMLSPG